MNAKYHINTKHLTINEGPNPGTPRTESGKYDIQAEEAVVNEYQPQSTSTTYELLTSIAEDVTLPSAISPPLSAQNSASLDPSRTINPTTLPPELATPEAMCLWQNLRAAGLVDADYRPVPSLTKQEIMWIAKKMSGRLFRREDHPVLKPFEQYWGIQRLNQEHFRYNETGCKPKRAKEIERAISSSPFVT